MNRETEGSVYEKTLIIISCAVFGERFFRAAAKSFGARKLLI
jgi:hypothetical protein